MTTREKSDAILMKMRTLESNFGTGTEFDLGTKEEKRKAIVALWREMKEVDPKRADLIKPQNPYVK